MLVEPPPPPPKPNAVICAELDTIPLGNCTELLIVPLGTEVRYELVAAFNALILVCAEPVKLFRGVALNDPPPPKPKSVICCDDDIDPAGRFDFTCTELLIVPLGTEVKYELVAAFNALILV